MPIDWQVLEGKRLFASRRELSQADDQQLAASQQYGVVPQSLMMRLNDSKVMLALKGTSTFRHVESGDFVISLRSFEGGIEYSEYSGCVSPAYTVLAARHNITRQYYRYLLKSGPFVAALQSTTVSLRDGKAISYGQFGAIRIPVPKINEQTQIAKFLDYETAKIDALIDKQLQLIALLKEKRQAVISHAVTKGLKPGAPMRDSGVEWLGEVPAHWEVKRLGYISSVGNGSTPNRSVPGYWAENIETGVGWLNSTKINDGEIREVEQFITFRAVRECHLPLCEPESVLIAITGEGQTRGRAALLKTTATINQHLAYLKPNRSRIDPCFLWRQLQAMYSWLRFESAGGGSTRAALTCDFLRNIPLSLPPLDEQRELANIIDKRIRNLDSIANKAQVSLDLLQERRAALISAAVTGKIDVRDWKAPEAETEAEVA